MSKLDNDINKWHQLLENSYTTTRFGPIVEGLPMEEEHPRTCVLLLDFYLHPPTPHRLQTSGQPEIALRENGIVIARRTNCANRSNAEKTARERFGRVLPFNCYSCSFGLVRLRYNYPHHDTVPSLSLHLFTIPWNVANFVLVEVCYQLKRRT